MSLSYSETNDWSISGYQGIAGGAKPGSNSADHSHTISRDSPLNLAWDSSMKENCQQQANAPNFRPSTPDNLPIPVDEILSPATQKQIRTTIRALFPNGPPPPPPVRPMRRPKKGDLPYIVNCKKRKRVPSPKGLNVFTGDKYGITSSTNYDEDEQCTPEKKARRGPNGRSSISKSTFNRQTNEIVDSLKLYEKIDKLVGRTPEPEPVAYMKRSFSPLPSTSTDNETIMKNDKHFSESLNCDTDKYDIDEDEELPEVIWDTDNVKKEKDRKDLSSPLYNNDIDNDNYTDSFLIEMNEDINNNNNDVIAIDDDFCEIEFDKLMPKEKILDYSDVEPDSTRVDPKEPENNVPAFFPIFQRSKASNDHRATTSTDVICVDDTRTTNILNPISTQASANSVTSPVLRASNTNATATETKRSDQVIEVPDVLEPVNMSREVSARLPAWYEDVQFVSEERVERPNNPTIENIPDVQIRTSTSGQTGSNAITTAMNENFLTCLTETYSRQKTKKKNKRTKAKEKLGVPCNTENALAINDENAAPINTENPNVNNGNAAPSVNQVQQSDTGSLNGSADSTPGKQLGECPICLDNLQRGSIASTNCGHVFCQECIKQSLKTSGKKCPTCRKQLKGVGYHQVFL
ncbi:probable E3 ubiquitin-protein ligase bre1 [Cydia amplana]|uniref:probable E3 ubiquitin-protein ligase bre1 n=1 Tax=Cydia amplana TaxID=1869771 RepID=UPI002FE68BF0